MKSVFNFYNNIGWAIKNGETIDSEIFEDNRSSAKDYVIKCRKKIQKYIPNSGKNFLDFASGPIQYN